MRSFKILNLVVCTSLTDESESLMKEFELTKDDLRPEYDFGKLGILTRGKYTEAYKQGRNLVLLDEDIAKAFPDKKAVNDALRLLMNLAKQQAKLTTPK